MNAMCRRCRPRVLARPKVIRPYGASLNLQLHPYHRDAIVFLQAAPSCPPSWAMVDSDPYAAPFYRRCGAIDVGLVPSDSIPGRLIPRLRFLLSDGAMLAAETHGNGSDF